MKVECKQFLLAVALLVVLAAAPYFQTANFSFVLFDDDLYVTSNDFVQHGLTWPNFLWTFTSGGYASNWHPLTWLSMMTDVSLFGVNPGPMHVVNALFHCLNAVLVLVLLRLLTGDLWASLFAAALWAVHPLRVESVAWISQRKEVLSTCFGLLTAICYVRGLQPLPPKASPDALIPATRFAPSPDVWRFFAAICFALALMSKPMTVTFPVLAALLEYAVTGRVRWRNLELLVWMAVAGILITIYVQSQGGAVCSLSAVPMPYRFLNAITSVGAYVQQSLLPFDLTCFYPMARPIPTVYVQSGMIACAAFAFLFWQTGIARQARAHGPAGLHGTNPRAWLPYAAACGWFLVALSPTLGLIQVGSQSHADRYTYWPSVGLALGLAWGIPQFSRERPLIRTAVCAGTTALIAASLWVTVRQTAFWRDTETLFTRAICVTCRNDIAYSNLGVYYGMQERFEEAAGCLRLAAAYTKITKIKSSYAFALAQAGRLNEATKLADAIRQNDPKDAASWCTLGIVANRRGTPVEAERLLLQAVRAQPTFACAWNDLGIAYGRQKRWPQAIACWRRTLSLDPSNTSARGNLELHVKRVDGTAVPDWRTLLDEVPDETMGLSPFAEHHE